MRSIDCYECRYNHWGIGLGLGVACVHPDNQKYNPKRRKQGEERTFHNSTTQVNRIPDGCELREERETELQSGTSVEVCILENAPKVFEHILCR